MSRLTATRVTFLLCLVAALTSSVVRAQDAAPAVTLKGYAVLPADTFSDGPPSGAQIDPKSDLNGRTIPFTSQPVQGFSAILPAANGNWLVMSDNGYGAKANSADFLYPIARSPRLDAAGRPKDPSVRLQSAQQQGL